MPSIKEFGGLDNQNSPTEYGLKRLEVAENVDITRNNKLATRKGRIKLHSAVIDAASATKSAMLYQSGDSLYKVVDQSGGVVVESNLSTTKWLFSAEVNDKIYWSNTVETGVIEGGQSRPLGLPTPEATVAREITGLMPAGTYLYALTYTRNDGFESGASLSGQKTVLLGGLSVDLPSNLPTNIIGVNLYLSSVNGDVLYFANIALPSAQAVTYTGDTLNFGMSIANQFCNKPVPFQSACYYRGRMYYAHGNVLWASLPFNFELIDYSQDYVAFDGDILMCAPVNDGLFVATNDYHYFVSGNDPQDFNSRKVLDYGAIRSAPVAVSKIGDRPDGMLWASNRGAIAGFDGGQVINMTDGVFAFGDAGSASGVYREQDGQKHLVISFNDETVPYNARRIFILSNVNSPISRTDGLISVGELLNAEIESIPMSASGV